MEQQASHCIDPRMKSEILTIATTENTEDLVHKYHSGDPEFLHQVRHHLDACASCRAEYPEAVDHLPRIEAGVRSEAVQQIHRLSVEYASQFSSLSAGMDAEPKGADRMAALASTYSAPLFWQLSYLLPNLQWKNFTVLVNSPKSPDKASLAPCLPYLNTLPRRTLLFVFTAVLANELCLKLYDKFWGYQFPTLGRPKIDGTGFEFYDNPDYPLYQPYELRMLQSAGYPGGDGEDHPLYGSAALLQFIRDQIREILSESSLDVSVLNAALEQTAVACVERLNEPNAQPTAVGAIHEFGLDVNDGIEATQMEILRVLEKESEIGKRFPAPCRIQAGQNLQSPARNDEATSGPRRIFPFDQPGRA